MPKGPRDTGKSELLTPAEEIILAASSEHDLSPTEIVTYESDSVRDDICTADPIAGLVFRVTRNRDKEGIARLLEFIDSSCNITALEIRFSAKDGDGTVSEMDCLVGYRSQKVTVYLKRARNEKLLNAFLEKLRAMFGERNITIETCEFRGTVPVVDETRKASGDGDPNPSYFRRSPE